MWLFVCNYYRDRMGKITPKLLHDLSIRLSICDDKTVSGNIRGFGVDPHLPELLRGKIDKRLLRMYSDRLRMAVIFRITHDLNSRHFPVNFTSDLMRTGRGWPYFSASLMISPPAIFPSISPPI